jgi:hypothetical protein
MTLVDLLNQWEEAQALLSTQIEYLEAGHLMFPADGDPRKFTDAWLVKLRAHRDQYQEMADNLRGML